jgi:ParB family chromosome partitioning protein
MEQEQKRKRAALDGTRLNAFAMDPNDLVVVGHDTQDGPEHPLYDERVKLPLDEAMVLNIQALGVIESVTVRKNGPVPEVVAGRRRVLHAREASKRNVAKGESAILVPTRVLRAEDSHAFAIAIAENELRRGDDPITRARKAARLMRMGMAEKDLSIVFGITTQQVRNLLSVLDLDPKVQKAIEAEKLPFTAAIQLTDLTREDQVAKMQAMLESGAVGVVEARRQRQARNAGKDGAEGTRGKRPGTAVIRKIAENEEFMGSLSDDARHLLHWILGDESHAKKVKGLTALLK